MTTAEIEALVAAAVVLRVQSSGTWEEWSAEDAARDALLRRLAAALTEVVRERDALLVSKQSNSGYRMVHASYWTQMHERADAAAAKLANATASTEQMGGEILGLRATVDSGQPVDVVERASDFASRLRHADGFLAAKDSIRAHPLRDTHKNDVPVTLAQFAAIYEARGYQRGVRAAASLCGERADNLFYEYEITNDYETCFRAEVAEQIELAILALLPSGNSSETP